ncbi:MAG: hypothetical protein CMO98_12355 [Woeseia sp.]|nr:hypothetical protein [Woeseia sp.]|tara:strand:+ start:1751 stop:2101 length:351 start_codon:yes stop_codon:yes gene_type:complete
MVKMNMSNFIGVFLIAGALTIVFFKVTFEFGMVPEKYTEIPDPAVEKRYKGCYQAKDDNIHTTAFGMIDNPDVQKEFITSSRAEAQSLCRATYPERLISIKIPEKRNLIDFEPRFW